MEIDQAAKSETVVEKITKALFPEAKKEKKAASPKAEKKKVIAKKRKSKKGSKAPFPVNPDGKVKIIQIVVPRDADNDSSTDEESPKKKRKLAAGKVEVDGVVIKRIGTKREVFHGKAQRTSGGLVKEDIIKSSSGRIVSRLASETAKKNWILRNGIKPKEKKADDSSASSSSSSSSEEEVAKIDA